MARFDPREDGLPDDEVTLTFNGQQVLIAKSYEVALNYYVTPSAFRVGIGSGDTALELMGKIPVNSRFGLAVGRVLQFAGRTDGFDKAGSTGTELIVSGRDAMARLHDVDIETEKTFSNATFEELVRYAIEGTGLRRDEYLLTVDTASQRKAITGTPIVEQVEVQEKIDLNQIRGLAIEPVKGQNLNFSPLDYDPTYTKIISKVTGFRADKPIAAKPGTSFQKWVEAEVVDRGGLFLRAAIDPGGVLEYAYQLGAPDGGQDPYYAIVHDKSAERPKNRGIVFAPTYQDNRAKRAAVYICHGRAGTGAQGRKKIEGRYTDEQMVRDGFGWKRRVLKEEVSGAKGSEHAEFLCRKACAADRRASWTLRYPVRGHTLPLLSRPTARAPIVPDTTIYVRDDMYGIDGIFWIEAVSYRAKAGEIGPMTEISLRPPEDLIFGDGGYDRSSRKKGKRKVFGKDL